jgi:hypothetical protein
MSKIGNVEAMNAEILGTVKDYKMRAMLKSTMCPL